MPHRDLTRPPPSILLRLTSFSWTCVLVACKRACPRLELRAAGRGAAGAAQGRVSLLQNVRDAISRGPWSLEGVHTGARLGVYGVAG